ncbi:MAG: right-handed parallel beta-helix repeat-containing protein [Pirellulales bacterium]
MRTLGRTVLVFAVLVAPLRAADIFVNNVGGDDLFDGSQETSAGSGGPVRTLRKALLVARSGDRIVLANSGEPYRESISLLAANHCGNAIDTFVIDGRGATLDGSVSVPEDAWEHFSGHVFRFRPQRSAYQQLFLNGRPALRHRVDKASGQRPDLGPLEWYLHEGHIYFRVEPGRLPGQYPLTYAGLQTGITLYHVHDVAVVDLVVQGFQLDGINAHDGVCGCYLSGITCRGNGRSGVTVAGSSRVQVQDCLLGDNGESQLRVEGLAIASLVDCELLPNTAPAFVRPSGRLFIDGRRQD